VETRLKVIESYCSDPTTLSNLQTEKTTPSTDATVSSTVRQDPTLLIFFESVLGLAVIDIFWKYFGSGLGLACQLDPTMLGPAIKAKPSGFWQRKLRLHSQFLTKNTGKERLSGYYSVIYNKL